MRKDKGMGQAGVYVEIDIRCPLDRVWNLTQEPVHHPRWDVRFTSITPMAQLESGGYRFRYERRLPFHTIVGTGTALGERARPDGTRTSALRFTTANRLSPLGDGRGYWRYVPTITGVTFITGYDYVPHWGRYLDALIVRRAIGWVTAWSFDRLRIWAETGIEPEHWPLWSVLQVWKPGRPRASRCRRVHRTQRPMDDAPATLNTLESP